MLQQTRVGAAIPYYEAFLERFPDVGALARARAATVLARWSGLGYYRRARHLHAAARVVARDGFPRTAKGWRALPGVGSYTAAAVSSIAFDEPAAAVDGNVARVLSRFHAIPGRAAEVRRLADAWLDPRAPGDHNQAMMELGATVCRPRNPLCSGCPLRAGCLGRVEPERYPAKAPRARPVAEVRDVAFALSGGRVRLRLRGDGERMAGLWDLPETEARGRVLAEVRHSVLDRRLLLRVRRGRVAGGGEWFRPERAERLPLTAGARKCLARVGFIPHK